MSGEMLAPLDELDRLHRVGCNWSRVADELGYDTPEELRVAAYRAHLAVEGTDV